ncbi:MAG: CRISPR-associated endonuclease Cas4g/Cas1g [Acidimicrobiales bacterium]
MSAPGDVPDLVPARMVNEFAHCPRLFFLEWVQARFADNDDTVDGRYQHRVVDDPGGRLPPPEEVGAVRARSVLLSSPRLGLVGRVDVVEGEGGVVRPIDVKRGRPAENAERCWEPERVQVCVLGLLLRDAGYECASGFLWFAESRERVEVVFSAELVARTEALVASLRQVAARDLPPAPLVASPKCPRCSLVGICLPDEHNALTDRSTRPARRLVARDDPARPLYVTEPGAVVGYRGGRIEVSLKGAALASRREIDVSQVCVFGNVQVTTQALRRFFANEVPVAFFSSGGWLQGMAEGLPSKHVELRRRQVVLAGQGGLEVARRLVAGKVRNCRTLLRRNGRPAPQATLDSLGRLVAQAGEAPSSATLLGLEGTAARLYFQALPTMLRPELRLPGAPFSFEGRNRRPPLDPVNCLLSFAYALLVKDLVAVLWTVGFDPYLGFFHRPRFGRPALALDLAEEFRPLVGDSVVVNCVNNGEVKPSHFVVRGQGVALTAEGRSTVLHSYERRMEVEVRHPVFGYRVSYRRLLELQARLLAAHVLDEVPEYLPFGTR